MTAMLKPSVEYNRRTAIIEGLRGGCSVMEIIRFFGYSFMMLRQNIRLQNSPTKSSMPARKSHSKECTARTQSERVLISDDLRQSHVLMDVVKPWLETMASRRPFVFQQDSAPAHMNHLIQNWLSDQYVLAQGILTSQ